jgi:dCMP deaminase
MRHASVKWDRRFLGLAAHIATWSKDPSTKCGAVIVRPDRTIASMGYNGFPRGVEDDPLLLENREEKYKRVVHAEMNALLFLREATDGLTLYTWPLPPCCRCAACLGQTSVRRVVSPRGSGPLWDRHDVSLTRQLLIAARIELEEVDYAASDDYWGAAGRDGSS